MNHIQQINSTPSQLVKIYIVGSLKTRLAASQCTMHRSESRLQHNHIEPEHLFPIAIHKLFKIILYSTISYCIFEQNRNSSRYTLHTDFSTFQLMLVLTLICFATEVIQGVKAIPRIK